MEIYIKGTPNEINEFLYGDSREVNRIAEEDNPNIPIGDDEEDDDNDEGTEVVQKIIVVKKK